MNLTGFTNYFARTAAQIEKTVQSTVNEVTGPKVLLDYELGEQTASGGPGSLWKIYKAKSKKASAHSLSNEVSVWILDKKSLAEERTRRGTSKAAEEALFDVFRSDAKLLLRLRHPGVVKVIEAMEENKSSMVMVTEPIFCSVANAYGRYTSDDSNMNAGFNKAEDRFKDLELSKLEIKHGLLQISETLHFLHKNARLIHRSISPESIFLTLDGAWKFGCFGFSTTVELATKEGSGKHDDSPVDSAFHYPEYDVDSPSFPLQPPLDFCAPEWTQKRSEVSGMASQTGLNLWGTNDSSGGANADPSTHFWTSSDVFSLGLLVYFLLTKKPLIKSKNNLNTYMSTIRGFQRDTLTGIDYDFENDLRRMVSLVASTRPSAEEFSNSNFFRNDIGVKALKFLDHILEKDSLQKTDFFKALTELWTDFDSRVLRYKVLPPLLTEIKNESLQVLTIPLILNIVEKQEPADFCSVSLPVLLPIFQNASGEIMLLFVKSVCMLANKVPSDVLNSSIFPLVVKSFDSSDVKIQEEILKGTPKLLTIHSFDITLFVQNILPRVHALALKTSVAAVRVHALLCLGELVSKVEKKNVLDIVQTLSRCSFVDHSVPTLMTVLSVADTIQKQYDEEFSAQYILPLLCPLLVVQQLSPVHFSKFINLFYSILKKIEKFRGVAVNANGTTGEIETNFESKSWMDLSSVPKQNEIGVQSSTSSTKPSSSSWDVSDWSTVAKKDVSPAPISQVNSVTDDPFMIPLSADAPLSLGSLPQPSATVSSPVSLSSEFEWIPAPKEKDSTTTSLSLASPFFSASSSSSATYPPPILPSTKPDSSVFFPSSISPAKPSSSLESLSATHFSNLTFDFADKDKSTSGGYSTGLLLAPQTEVQSVDDDPFADWPPKPPPQPSLKQAGNTNLSFPSVPSSDLFNSVPMPPPKTSNPDFGDFFSSPSISSSANSGWGGTQQFPNTIQAPVPSSSNAHIGLKLAPPPPSGSSVGVIPPVAGIPPATIGYGVGRGRGRISNVPGTNAVKNQSSENLGSLLDL